MFFKFCVRVELLKEGKKKKRKRLINNLVMYVNKNRKYKTEVSSVFISLFYSDIFVGELRNQ